jgi:hypothetical protein
MRVRNGKITEHWGVANLFSLMQQLRRLAGRPFYQGEPGATGLSRMPMVLSRRIAAAP